MGAASKDNVATIGAIGLLAYVSADVAHHALGHGAACLALGGRIRSLSSIFVDCSLTGSAIDLAGPFANLVVGLAAVLCIRIVHRTSTAMRLFVILVAAFNLLWIELQLVFSAATRTDDWAWAMQQFHIGGPVRSAMIALGALLYVLTVRFIGSQMAPFGHPRTRAKTIVATAWLTAGAIACATAAFDHNAAAAIVRHGAPQSLLLSIGLLFTPARAERLSSADGAAATLTCSVPWIVIAVFIGAASMVFLGPGFALAI
ncbi:MAG TPA: hypothetical protein VK700_04090 [Steroidobacteraceae bacterium]|jgi:hypothetical protein|nr:hypothetical protein [Steroidobacteraceae bacterium]